MGFPKISMEIKREAARLFLVSENRAEAARKLGIHHTNFTNWQRQPWFQEMLETMRSEIEEDSKARLRLLAQESDSVALDRLRNGDSRVAKDGTLISVPMSGRDAAVIGAIARDKLRLAEGKPTRITASLDAIVKMREQMTRSVNSVTLEGEVVRDQITDSSDAKPSAD